MAEPPRSRTANFNPFTSVDLKEALIGAVCVVTASAFRCGSQGNIQLKKIPVRTIKWNTNLFSPQSNQSLYTEKRLNAAIDFSGKVSAVVMGSR